MLKFHFEKAGAVVNIFEKELKSKNKIKMFNNNFMAADAYRYPESDPHYNVYGYTSVTSQFKF